MHTLAGLGDALRKVAVAGLDALAMVDLDEVAVAAVIPFGPVDDAVGGGIDRRAQRAARSMPGCMAALPRNGSVRTPKVEVRFAPLTGEPAGMATS